MRALIGALVGLVAGAAIVGALNVSFASKAYWSVLLAGLAAGIAMRVFAGGGGSPYAKGALAAIATALAAVGGPIAATQWFSSISSPLQGAVVVEQSDDEAGEEADADAAPLLEAPVVVPETPNPLSTVSLKRPTADTSSMKDIACLVIGCLLAYQMGKGAGPKAAPPEETSADASAGSDDEGGSGNEADA